MRDYGFAMGDYPLVPGDKWIVTYNKWIVTHGYPLVIRYKWISAHYYLLVACDKWIAALSAARDLAAAAEWKYHNRIINMRDAVSGQYGRNSNEVQKVGRKKTSEFSPRKRKPPTS